MWKKGNEGDEKNKQKKTLLEKCFFIFWNKLVITWNVFYLPKFTIFFQKSATIQC